MRAHQKNSKIRTKYEGLTTSEGRWNGTIRLLNENLYLPARKKKPAVWAVWNDLFHKDVPENFIDEALAVAVFSEQHKFLILTKRAARMAEYFTDPKLQTRVEKRLEEIIRCLGTRQQRWDLNRKLNAWSPLTEWPLKNVFLGVTAEDQARANERVPLLLQTPATVRFVNCEPLLSAIWFMEAGIIECTTPTCDMGRRWTNHPTPKMCYKCGNKQIVSAKIDVVISGGESGPNARPVHPDWVRMLLKQCKEDDIRFFFKQWGDWEPSETQPSIDTAYHRVSDGTVAVYFPWVKKHWWGGRDGDGKPLSVRVGKKAAGRLMDGQTWDECLW